MLGNFSNFVVLPTPPTLWQFLKPKVFQISEVSGRYTALIQKGVTFPIKSF